MSAPLWTPSPVRIAESSMDAFRRAAEVKSGGRLPDSAALHAWSIDQPEVFGRWSGIFRANRRDKGGGVIENGDAMPGARFFPRAKLNFAENLLRRRGESEAIVFRAEDKVERRLSWDDLHSLTSRFQQLFIASGIVAGDRIAAMMPNMPETVAAMLAAAGLGAIWSSCSPDFGEQGVLDRFGQIEPKLFIASDGYFYAGKTIDVSGKIAAVTARLPTVERAIIVPLTNSMGDAGPKAARLDDLLAPFAAGEIRYERLPFSHPLYILFSSGTTGIPKCIVHSAGGTLLQHAKEHRLHAGIGEDDRLFYFTTCGWMMWNWLLSGLAAGATLLLYDGSPFHPDGNVLFDFASAERMTHFGTSAKFIDSARKAGIEPRRTHDLSALRALFSTGSPLSPEGFDWVYAAVKADLHLASISGGTDIVSCFVLGDPTRPVRSGEIQGPGLGMAVDVWDEVGRPVRGEKGELVCTRPFPAMPIGFWNDPGGEKYRAAYFERFPGVWRHGDFAEWTEYGGMVIHGRSDATLNPGGVRIGTAEIYNQVEQLTEIAESLCIGQEFDGDVRIVLFVRLAAGTILDDALRQKIRAKIRSGASPRHVPAKIVAVADIPRTKSGKITELAVRDVVHGRDVKNKEALANPEALDLFRNLAALAD
ncbi:MAG: acetoacetate--CoA ligase [Phyllobacteriaceae bacterium]|nr:acetoacetate--CoA ligase [Phyllobacteriaceae bacterium]